VDTNSSNNRTDAHVRLAVLPALAALQLDDGDADALARQGFIAAERRGERSYFRLRFRRDGRQRVRYIGSLDRAQAVQFELDRLRVDVRLQRRLATLSRDAARSLRDAKRTLEPLLEARGFHFHGQAIRKCRCRK
jgi:hypothetical protein